MLIDVRQPWEHGTAKIKNAELILLGNIPLKIDSFTHGQPYVIFCHHGIRSMSVTLFLIQNGYSNVLNLLGGIEAWRQEVDDSIASY